MLYTERIKALRSDHDLNQTQVARAIHVAQTTYSDYEKGKVRIPVECLIQLAKFYDVDMNYISGVSDTLCPFLPITHQKGPPLQEAPFAYHGLVRMGDAARFLVFSGKCAQIL